MYTWLALKCDDISQSGPDQEASCTIRGTIKELELTVHHGNEQAICYHVQIMRSHINRRQALGLRGRPTRASGMARRYGAIDF